MRCDLRYLWLNLAVSITCSTAWAAQQKPETVAAPTRPDELRPWLDDLAKAATEAQRSRQPILVRFGAEWCGWCKKLDVEIADADVQKELARWTLVAVDIDRSPDQASSLGVASVPALRLLTPTRRLVASRDGVMTAGRLVAWLREHYEEAAAALPEELTEAGPPSLIAATRLVRELGQRDAVRREAAVRRLVTYPEVAAEPVADAFARGKLQTRLAAFELLSEWKAPLEGVDPWQPATLSPDRLHTLKSWATERAKEPFAAAPELAPDQLTSARREIATLLQATDDEAETILARLARFRRALMPEVLTQLHEAITDLARRRLTALRYRLVSADALALEWPAGLNRLAASDAQTRRDAVEQLAERATAAEEDLLLELFADPDPLLRETSLQALHRVSGSRATGAMARLLHDPEPSVRAAVLKQLTEKAPRSVIPVIKEYVADEKDADLVVHAVRVLRSAGGPSAVECLMGMLGHESWRVRAEAAEAMKECLGRTRSADESHADAYAALIRLLDDEDGFVVSRAVAALVEADLAVAVEPLAKAAETHPELATEALKALAQGDNTRKLAVPHMRRFCGHADPAVRAAAIAGLCSAAGDDCEQELAAALRDATGSVRVAAADAFFELAESDRRSAEMLSRQAKDSDPEAWLEKYRSGKGRPKWTASLAGDLEKLSAAAHAEERAAGALALVTMARDEHVLPVLLDVAKSDASLVHRAGQALAWLPWDGRLKFFNELRSLQLAGEPLAQIVGTFGRVSDDRALPPLWELLANEKCTADVAIAVHGAIMRLYFGDSYYYDASRATAADRKRAAADAREQAASGPDWARAVALKVLAAASQNDAAEIARTVFDDATQSEPLRRNALHCLLLSQSAAESQRTAVAVLSSHELDIRRLAMVFLARGSEGIRYSQQDLIPLYQAGAFMRGSAAQPAAPKVPSGLDEPLLEQLVRDPESEFAAYAGYFLALQGEAAGLRPLLRYWREKATRDSEWTKLVHRAIAAIGDDAQTPLLEEIYNRLDPEDNEQAKDLYWSIRSMSGPQVLKLRKRIRDDVGMENLR